MTLGPNDEGVSSKGPAAPPHLRIERDHLLRITPEAVKEAIPLDLWNRDLLYALDLPVRDVAIRNLAWLFDVPLWAVNELPFQVTPDQVRLSPEHVAEQPKRTVDSDLAWPIHILRRHNRWTILDGVHRLLKADMLGYTAIQAMVLSAEDYTAIVYPRIAMS